VDAKKIALAALCLSGLACVLAAVAATRGERAPAVASAAADPSVERWRQLSDQTAALRADLDRLASAAREGASPRQPMEKAPEVAPQPTSVPPELLQRLSALEQSVAALQRASQDRAPRAETARTDPTDLAEARRHATDLSASEENRLAALKMLRGQKWNGQDARSGDVLLSMIDLAEHSASAANRLDAYRNLHGVNDPQLRDSMLRALAGDPDPRVREKVAQDIDTFLPDVGVENGLRQAADGDSDAGVRAQAVKTLAGRR
jgi:hypothetical protein